MLAGLDPGGKLLLEARDALGEETKSEKGKKLNGEKKNDVEAEAEAVGAGVGVRV